MHIVILFLLHSKAKNTTVVQYSFSYKKESFLFLMLVLHPLDSFCPWISPVLAILLLLYLFTYYSGVPLFHWLFYLCSAVLIPPVYWLPFISHAGGHALSDSSASVTPFPNCSKGAHHSANGSTCHSLLFLQCSTAYLVFHHHTNFYVAVTVFFSSFVQTAMCGHFTGVLLFF